MDTKDTHCQDLNVDVYKQELWKIVEEIFMLQGCDIQKIEDQIFALLSILVLALKKVQHIHHLLPKIHFPLLEVGQLAGTGVNEGIRSSVSSEL